MLNTLYLLPAMPMAVPDSVHPTVLKHQYVKQAPISRPTLTELSNRLELHTAISKKVAIVNSRY